MKRTVVLAAALVASGASPVFAWGAKGEATTSVLVNATPRVVWRAIHDERNQDPDVAYAKVLNRQANIELLEEKFIGIPVLGQVVAVTRANETPYKSIEYSLVKSDKFKDFKGRWQLTPARGGKATMVTLTNFLDTGLPFGASIVKTSTKEHVNRRLGHVKQLAEDTQRQLAASGKEDL